MHRGKHMLTESGKHYLCLSKWFYQVIVLDSTNAARIGRHSFYKNGRWRKYSTYFKIRSALSSCCVHRESYELPSVYISLRSVVFIALYACPKSLLPLTILSRNSISQRNIALRRCCSCDLYGKKSQKSVSYELLALRAIKCLCDILMRVQYQLQQAGSAAELSVFSTSVGTYASPCASVTVMLPRIIPIQQL